MSKLSEVLKSHLAENAQGQNYNIGKFDGYYIELFLNTLIDGVAEGQVEGGESAQDKLKGILPDKLLKSVDEEQNNANKVILIVAWLEQTLGLPTMWDNSKYTDIMPTMKAPVAASFDGTAVYDQDVNQLLCRVLQDIKLRLHSEQAWAAYIRKDNEPETEKPETPKDGISGMSKID